MVTLISARARAITGSTLATAGVFTLGSGLALMTAPADAVSHTTTSSSQVAAVAGNKLGYEKMPALSVLGEVMAAAGALIAFGRRPRRAHQR